MSRKQYSKELKLELVKKHLEDGISYWKLGKEYGIEASIIRRWGHKYEMNNLGSVSLLSGLWKPQIRF